MIDYKKTVLGIEFGSTRIKAVLIDENHVPVANGEHCWENSFVNGIWTYSINDIHTGLQSCYCDLIKNIGHPLTEIGAIGISGMMHGYMPFNRNGELLTEFRTWRNTNTCEAAEKLSDLFGFNIPQRWSIAHLYQAFLNKEPHVKDVSYISTLSGYISEKLTGKRVSGVGDASGIFPIDSRTGNYDSIMAEKFHKLTGIDVNKIFPEVRSAGEIGGYLTPSGAAFIDPSGNLRPGIPVAPCEGDAGTGMVATNSVRVGTGNVSAGTSVFAMIVTDRLPGVHREIDMVTTPTGEPVAMVHCNNCTSDINDWAGLFIDFAEKMGFSVNKDDVFSLLFSEALCGDADCGGLMNYNYHSGEGVTNVNDGRPLFVRSPSAKMNLANFMRTQLLSALSTLKIGLDILSDVELVRFNRINAHGGFFKTPKVGQTFLSAAIHAPVSVTETAGEGGPYGMALLAAYMLFRKDDESLADYLDNRVFRDAKTITVNADAADIEAFDSFLSAYKRAFILEEKAPEVM